MDNNELLKLIKRASDTINQITNYKIPLGDRVLEDYPVFISDQVKLAVACQVEYIAQNGEAINHGGGMSSVSVGNFSYQKKEKEGLSRNEKRVSPATIEYLSPTGLLYTGVDTRD